MGYKLKAALRTTLVPEIGPAPTSFTRNLPAYVTDFEGLFKLVPANCARFAGARFVQNILSSDSEALTTWVKQTLGVALPSIVTGGLPDPDGGNNAFRVQTFLNGSVSGSDFSGIGSGNTVSIVGRKTTRQMWVKSNTGGNQQFTFVQGGAYQAVATPVWKLHVVPVGGNDVNGFTFGSRGSFNGDVDILVYHPMLELVDGQSNQNASEYVRSVGGVFPYAGAGAPGCAFFDYLNGNTVVTDNTVAPANHYIVPAKGAAIATATLRRYRKERSATNSCLQSNAFDNATWQKTLAGVALAPVVTPDFAVAPDGTLTADRVQFNLNGGTTTGDIANLQQAFTYTANLPYTFAVWLKSNTGANQTLALFVFNSQGGNITITPQWQRFVLIQTPGVSTGSSFGLRARGAQGMTAAADVLIWSGYHEQTAAVPTSDIPTTTVAVNRPEDLLVYPNSVFSNAVGTCSALAEPDAWTANDVNNRRVIGGATPSESGAPLFGTLGGFGTYDNTAAAATSVATPVGAARGAATWSAAANNKRAYINGVASNGGNAYDGSFNNTGVGIGLGGGLPWQGYIGDVVILDTALSEFDIPSLPDYQYPRLLPQLLSGVVSKPSLTGVVAAVALKGSVAAPQITGAVPPTPALVGVVKNLTLQGSV